MKFDPYELLGISRSATAAAIKTAYRAKVQVAHPDRGGDPASFIAIVRAFGLLSDPDARRLYDETGRVDDEGVKGYRREVAQILTDMFDAAVATAVNTGLPLPRVDFIAQMRSAVRTGMHDSEAALKRADRELESLRSLRTRIKRSDDSQNLFSERLEIQIRAKAEAHHQIKRRLAMLETALTELGSYSSEVELITALETAS